MWVKSINSYYSPASQNYLAQNGLPPQNYAGSSFSSVYSAGGRMVANSGGLVPPVGSVASMPNTTTSNDYNPALQSQNGECESNLIPSFAARTTSLPRNYGRESEWGDKPNLRRGSTKTSTERSDINSFKFSLKCSLISAIYMKEI